MVLTSYLYQVVSTFLDNILSAIRYLVHLLIAIKAIDNGIILKKVEYIVA